MFFLFFFFPGFVRHAPCVYDSLKTTYNTLIHQFCKAVSLIAGQKKKKKGGILKGSFPCTQYTSHRCTCKSDFTISRSFDDPVVTIFTW